MCQIMLMFITRRCVIYFDSQLVALGPLYVKYDQSLVKKSLISDKKIIYNGYKICYFIIN